MQPFIKQTGRVAAMNRADVDTDQIIPKQFLKRVERAGFEDYLFFDWRFDADGAENPEFELNQENMRDASILVARRNFGCGSSREHAVWALENYGFRVVLAPSFADIFFNNCFKNGVLPLPLDNEHIDYLFEQQAKAGPAGYEVTVDLESQTISDGSGWSIEFEVDAFRKHCLLNGLDDIALTLEHEDKIAAFEEQREAAV